MIRGLDGDRIRILRNGVGALDASSLSYDHAVPLDPVNVERVEIVRGPAALLYGGNAIGGVVNTFDNRIPDAPVQGIHGAGELRYGGADTTRSSAGKLEAGDGRFALHLDANSRQFNDLRIPGYARSSKVRDADEPGSKHRLENSDGRQDGGAVGGAYHWDHGYAGLSYSGYDSNYGSVAESGVRLDMKQDHYGFASELRDLDGPFSSVKVDAGYTDYEHSEIEQGEVHTTFKNKGYEARIEARHQPLGPVEGVIGAQVSRRSTFWNEGCCSSTELNGWPKKLDEKVMIANGVRVPSEPRSISYPANTAPVQSGECGIELPLISQPNAAAGWPVPPVPGISPQS